MTVHDARGPVDDVDVAILDDLARIHDLLDPVPPGLAERSLFAMTLAALETEVMELAEVVTDPAGVRSAEPVPARTVTFTSAATTVMITFQASGPSVVRLDGWVAPVGEGVDVELHSTDGVVPGRADEDGRFAFPQVAHGPVSLVVRPVGGAAMSTPVVEV
ncbi:hypothetical protein CLV28_0493 [Sediminihabitans luteus]|uniref:Uncharacterized protein n=1 Tax=Sediminihabitans luteus TaxID=1138585 RepID=A0A2M9CZD0_9CELL|nr:hypothetical protein [Sediminihabitans luteus]PJJ77279.1 hypothetical protein CLV28_0493 [Sediminihabitans luteus]GII98729.1 hypothetical protein Slu03_11070 [Sediminihabitans luteus]